MAGNSIDRYITTDKYKTHAKAYFERCKKEHLPVVYARNHGKHDAITMDLIYVPNSDQFNHNITFRYRMIDAFQEVTKKRYGRNVLPGLYTHCSVLAGKSEMLMQIFLDIYDTHKNTVSEATV